MPYGPDKLLLNGLDFEADSHSMMNAFQVGAKLGEEIIELGGGSIIGNDWLKEDAKLHLAEQESICKDLDDMMAKCIERQRALNNTRRLWIDSKL